ncbi:MAG: ABC transporter permease subunit [Desulfobulbus sp.]|uniref:ABC transporter permease subunit n=1 Tax=Desulfobulbus sp. TaxID=895 RepID=UPI00283F0CFA|nr:ABC transporter permease subunit [Desulfobulbus sp.]MDR2550381.1 ABC transporter permease subunit [Desulfobulbus sp.]
MKGGLRDRLIQSLLLAGFFFLFSTMVFSSFSMRQPMEVAINYSLATVQILAVLITLFLGLNLLSREIESRAGHGVLTQPLSRSAYVLGKFFGLMLLCCIVVAFLALCAVIGVLLVRAGTPNAPLILWENFGLSLMGILLISLLLGAASLLFCAVATSAILPFLATIAIWVIGNSTQTVKNYLDANIADQAMTPQLKAIITGAYYVFPNLSLLDFKVYAIYGLPLAAAQVGFALTYGLAYTIVLLTLATRLFQTRDML